MSESEEQRPNIIFIFSDQQRWDTIGAYGQRLDVTPNLDQMAQDGVVFDNAYSCQPVCGPARAVLQTGKFATEVGCHYNNMKLPLDEDTIAKNLARNGYEVGYIGKWHLASCGEKDGPEDFRERPVPPERRGGYKDFWIASDVLEFTSHGHDGFMFDAEGNKKFFPEGRFRADAQTDWVLEYLETRKLDKPFFLFNSYIEPHHQNDRNCYEGPHGSKEKWADYDVPGDLADTEGDWRENYPDYLGCINSLDRNVGRIRDKLVELGIADNTLIIYTSDHGSHFRTRNREYKRSCHDSSIHIPLIVSGPGFRGGQRFGQMTGLIDLPPTVLAAAGIEPPEFMQGRPIQEIVSGGQDWPEDVYTQISESCCGRAIRTPRWTYSVVAPTENGRAPFSSVYFEDFLYDNESDPHQKNNLIKDPELAEVRETLKKRLLKHISKAGEPQPEILPAR